MIKGTTPSHSWTLPFSTEFVKECSITYVQDKIPILIKRTEDCILEQNVISTRLTQQETLSFCDRKGQVEIQLKLKVGDEVIATPIQKVSIDRILDVEVF